MSEPTALVRYIGPAAQLHRQAWRALPVNEALKTVVRAFQADVQRGLALLRQYTGVDEPDHARDHSLLGAWRSLRSRVDRSHGYLDADKRHHYFFHGIGVRVQLAPGLHIDWDVGHGGRMDGFDEWRLEWFLKERPELQRILPLDSLGEVFDAAVRDGSILSPWGDDLYYIAGDLSAMGK